MSMTQSAVVPIKGLRAAGSMLVVLPLLSLLVLAHHPTIAAHDVHEATHQLAAVAGFAALVHGMLIAGQCGILYALLTWLDSRNLANPLPRAAAIMLLLGTVGVIGAALVDGFIVPQVATFPHEGDPGLMIMDQLIRYSMSLNQVLIVAGELALSAAFALLSADLIGIRGGSLWVGAAGLVLAGGSILGLLTGFLVLHLRGMQILFAAQSVWLVWLGIFILRSAGDVRKRVIATPTVDHTSASG